jgi:hypothetical protein
VVDARPGWRRVRYGKPIVRYRRGQWFYHFTIPGLCGVLIGPYPTAREASWAPDDLEDQEAV